MYSKSEYRTSLRSNHGYGAILLQNQLDDNFIPFFIIATELQKPSQGYNNYDVEMLAIINSIKCFDVYLLGIYFKVFTDCNSETFI